MKTSTFVTSAVVLVGLFGFSVSQGAVGNAKCSELKSMGEPLDLTKYAHQWYPYASSKDEMWDSGCSYLTFHKPADDGTFTFTYMDYANFNFDNGKGQLRTDGYTLEYPDLFKNQSGTFRVVDTDYMDFALVVSCDAADNITQVWVYSKWWDVKPDNMDAIRDNLRDAGYISTSDSSPRDIYVIDHNKVYCQVKHNYGDDLDIV